VLELDELLELELVTDWAVLEELLEEELLEEEEVSLWTVELLELELLVSETAVELLLELDELLELELVTDWAVLEELLLELLSSKVRVWENSTHGLSSVVEVSFSPRSEAEASPTRSSSVPVFRTSRTPTSMTSRSPSAKFREVRVMEAPSDAFWKRRLVREVAISGGVADVSSEAVGVRSAS
jgi:hypothetical protein